jgi:hypothetical protein
VRNGSRTRRTAGRSFTAISSRKPPSAALQHDKADIPGLVGLYAKLGGMRVLSSRSVIHAAESITQKIVDTYLQPDKTFVELRSMVSDGRIDLLCDFSAACREEFEEIRAQQF